MPPVTRFNLTIPENLAGVRLDRALAELFPDYSRARLQQWIKAGRVLLDNRSPRARDKLAGGETLQLDAEPEVVTAWQAQAMPLEILHQDADLLVVNKPAGLVTHPGAGNPDGTLVNALLHHAPELQQLPRAGIIHRLDKDTSGLLVVARSSLAHARLGEQLQAREFEREYLAVVNGVMTAGGCVDAPIGRHPDQRVRMAVVNRGKPARTHYRVERRYRSQTLLRLNLETGRTHQIRVHLAHIRYPLVGDWLYGSRPRPPAGADPELLQCLQAFPRQALHARRLGFIHPRRGEFMSWETPLPEDMQKLINLLEEDEKRHRDFSENV